MTMANFDHNHPFTLLHVHGVQVKLFVADKRAEILRAQVSEEERLKAEQNVHAAAVAVAGKACKVVQEFVARNARMSRRVAGLRANVEVRLSCQCVECGCGFDLISCEARRRGCFACFFVGGSPSCVPFGMLYP